MTEALTEPVAVTKPRVTIIEATSATVNGSKDGTKKKLKVAAYARVSTEQDEQQASYEAQVDYYSNYIKNHPDWQFVDIFSDEGITGTSTKARDGFNLMVDTALHGGIDLILTKSISRFARNTVDTLQTVRDLKSAGVEVIFEKENLHTKDPKCEVMLTIMSSLAQEESRSISENVRWGKQKSMQDGKVIMAYSRFLGYRKGEDGRPEIVEEEAEIVRMIYDLFLADHGIKEIARLLTAKGIPSPMGKKVWPPSTVASILSNEKYKGDALLQKTFTEDYLTKKVRKNTGERRKYLVEYSHEPIIEREVFDAVQKKLGERSISRHRIRTNSPFSAKIICGDCGGFFGHKVWHNHDNTERYDVWCCNERSIRQTECQSPAIRETEIIQAFEMMLEAIDYEQKSYDENIWRSLVEEMVIKTKTEFEFLLKDGRRVAVG